MSRREKIYKLSTPIATIRTKMFIVSAKLENADSLIAQIRQEGLERLNRLCANNPQGGVPSYMSQIERVRDIFAGNEVYTPIPPGDSSAHRSLSDSNAQNQILRDSNAQNQEVRVICYDCRQELDNLPQFQIERHGGTITLCADCHEYEKHEIRWQNDGMFTFHD